MSYTKLLSRVARAEASLRTGVLCLAWERRQKDRGSLWCEPCGPSTLGVRLFA